MTRGVLAKLRWLLISIAVTVPVAGTPAHESRPAYLEITETAPGRYDVLWRTPVLSGVRLPVMLRMPADARNMTESAIREFQDSLVERRMVEIPGGLAGKRIEFPGLEATGTAVLARVQLGDGAYYTILVHPSQPWIQIAAAEGRLTVFGTYVKHGIEHILLGYDHLLFVLALVLIVSSVRVLVWTITAFTIAHSITLALATLGVVRVPGPPVEATIALSILLLAAEILRVRQGRLSVTARWPWVVAFTFGLLHGFGFAGALTSIGLPKNDVPLALFAFNVGVEVGQLLFIAVVLGVLALVKRVPLPHPFARRALPVASYVIGALAALWFIERLSGF